MLRGWGQYFRTGNAANHFTDLDQYVERRLRGLLLKRAGSRLTAGRAAAWTRPFFEALGSFACAVRFAIRGWRMPRPEDHLVSRVREIRMHGLNGGLILTRSAGPSGDK
jgi:hypothetical protein